MYQHIFLGPNTVVNYNVSTCFPRQLPWLNRFSLAPTLCQQEQSCETLPHNRSVWWRWRSHCGTAEYWHWTTKDTFLSLPNYKGHFFCLYSLNYKRHIFVITEPQTTHFCLYSLNYKGQILSLLTELQRTYCCRYSLTYKGHIFVVTHWTTKDTFLSLLTGTNWDAQEN